MFSQSVPLYTTKQIVCSLDDINISDEMLWGRGLDTVRKHFRGVCPCVPRNTIKKMMFLEQRGISIHPPPPNSFIVLLNQFCISNTSMIEYL